MSTVGQIEATEAFSHAQSSEPIRVGFVLHAMQVAGAEMLVVETIRRLSGLILPTVFCLDAVGPLGEGLREQGVEVLPLGRRPGRDLSVGPRLASAAVARGIKVLHAHQYTPFFYSALAKLSSRFRFRLAFTEHGRHFPDVVSATRRTANRLILGHLADEINAVCEFSRRSLGEVDGFPASRIRVIENGIHPELYGRSDDRSEARRLLGLDPDRRLVVVVARFHPVKDHSTLLHAFAKVAKELDDIDLLLVGDGPLRPDLERLVSELGLGDRAKFLGVRRDVGKIFRAADLFAMTSISEAASLTILEAMASGLPVVVTNVGGNPEIIRDGIEGCLVPRGDPAATAAAILRILCDPKSAGAMGEAGRTRVLRHYDLNRTIDSYHDMYRALTSARGEKSPVKA